MTPDVEQTDPDGIDYGWVMQMTFVMSIVVGVPIVAVLSIPLSLPTWPDRAMFALRAGAPVWFLISVAVYLYAKRKEN